MLKEPKGTTIMKILKTAIIALTMGVAVCTSANAQVEEAKNACYLQAQSARQAYKVKEAGGTLAMIQAATEVNIKADWPLILQSLFRSSAIIAYSASSEQEAYDDVYNNCKATMKSEYGITF